MSSATKQTIRIQTWVTAVGVLLLAIKFTAYFLTNSVAILTDALESIVNVVAGFISLYSLYVAAKPRDAEHPYGHGKAQYLSAAVEGTLIGLAGIFIIIEAVDNLLQPEPVGKMDYGVVLIAVAGIVNGVAGYIALQTGKKNRSLAVTATGKHLISDAWSSAGLVVGLAVLLFTKITWIDSVIALLFAVIIIVTGYKILRKSISGIMDEADEALLKDMVTILNRSRRKTWIDLHNLRVIQYGDQLHVDCHLTLPWYMNLHEAHRELDVMSNIISDHFGDSLEMFVHTDGCLPFSCKLCLVEDCPVRQHPFEQRIEWTSQNIFQNKKHTIDP